MQMKPELKFRLNKFNQNKRPISEIGTITIRKETDHYGKPVFLGYSPVGVVFCESEKEIEHRVQFLDFIRREAVFR